VNQEIVLATLEQRLRSPVRCLLAMALVFFASGPYWLALFIQGAPRELVASSHGGMLALVFAAGVLGQEFSSGAPQLTFTRPLPRWQWVLSRAATVAAIASVLSVIPYLPAILLGIPLHEIALAMLGQVGEAVATTAVVTGLSSLVPGLTDLALLAGANIGLGILGMVAAILRDPQARNVVTWLKTHVEPWFTPHLDLVRLAHGASWSNHALLVILSTIAFWLVVAIAMSNRKELSYATD
jgi:hypothetical protein